MTIGTILSTEERLQEQVNSLRQQVGNLNYELYHYRDENKKPSWLQAKMMSQAKALTNLNKRVRMQRLILRELNVINPELADTIFNLVKDKYPVELNDQIQLTF